MYQNVNKLIEILYCEKYFKQIIAQAQFIKAEMAPSDSYYSIFFLSFCTYFEGIYHLE